MEVDHQAGTCTVISLEHILVFLKSPVDHIKEARRVLWLLYETSVTLNLKKCRLFAETIGNLGHIIRPGCLELADAYDRRSGKT